MPYDEVMPKFKKGKLHSGSDKGPVVTKRKQAVAIMLSEKREAAKGKKEYQKLWKGGDVNKPREEWEPQKPKEKWTGGTFPLGGQSREEWEPQQNPGIQNNFPASTEDKDYPDILKPVQADTKTQGLKKGGTVTKHSEKGWRRW